MAECPSGADGTKACPVCGKVTEDWARICPACEYEWAEATLPRDKAEEANALRAFAARLEREGPRPVVVPILVALNVAVFLLMALTGVGILLPATADLVRWGADFPPMTTHGQWWRMLTATFLHAGLLHLGFNMMVLWSAGKDLERILGRGGILVTYLLSGLCGSLASMVFHPFGVSVGASGAIFGLFGALLGFLLRDREALPPGLFTGMGKNILAFLGYNLLFALRVQSIDLAAHAGGLLGGFACGLALAGDYGEASGPSRRVRNGWTAAVGLAAITLLALRVPGIQPPPLPVSPPEGGGRIRLPASLVPRLPADRLAFHLDQARLVLNSFHGQGLAPEAAIQQALPHLASWDDFNPYDPGRPAFRIGAPKALGEVGLRPLHDFTDPANHFHFQSGVDLDAWTQGGHLHRMIILDER